MIRILILALLFTACSKKISSVLPDVESTQLQQEVDRITPLLLWCDGQAAATGKNNVDLRKDCDVGDAMAESGFLALLGSFENKQQMLDAMMNSFEADDQPHRAPSYVGKNKSNEFSRDQYLGAMGGTIAGAPYYRLLGRIQGYVKKTGRLCPHSSDSKCIVTPEMGILAKEVNGNASEAERIIAEKAMVIESTNIPLNYRANLILTKIFVYLKLNKLKNAHAVSAKNLYKRMPNNLWAKTIYLTTNKGNDAGFTEVADSLLVCMKQWEKPGSNWTFGKGNVSCTKDAYGHELVALAHFLLRLEKKEVLK